MDKRRPIKFLPAVNQTENLKKFFGATVDHLFQPGSSETLAGYIGRKPSYYKADTDFYVKEKTATRQAYQLEPTVISKNAANETTHIFFYEDLINYVRSNNGIVSDHNRLFSSEYYSWAPPIDLDKLLNFRFYYWFGDDPDALPALPLVSPVALHVADGRTKVFDMPAPIAGFTAADETPVVLVDYEPALFEVRDGRVSLVDTPLDGAIIAVYRYGDLRRMISGRASFDASGFNTHGVGRLTSGMRVKLYDAATLYQGFDRLPFENYDIRDPRWRLEGSPFDTRAFDTNTVDVPYDAAPALNDVIVEGVGEAIVLVDYDLAPVGQEESPIHVVIDRKSPDRSPWSVLNYWFHEDSYAWAALPFASRRAKRPVVEFLDGLQLEGYGFRRQGTVTAVIDADVTYVPYPFGDKGGSPGIASEYDAYPFEHRAFDTYGFGELPVREMNRKAFGTVFVDAGQMVRPGDRILVRNNADPNFAKRILTVSDDIDFVDVYGVEPDHDGNLVTVPYRSQRRVLAVEASPPPQVGDIVFKRHRGYVPFDEHEGLEIVPFDHSFEPVEYYFDGIDWQEAQRRDPMRSDPLFRVYDHTGRPLKLRAEAQARGNRIFGFAEGTGAPDPVLNRRLRYDRHGEIVFEHDLVTHKAMIARKPYSGYQFVKRRRMGSETLLNGWHKAKAPTRQTVEGGVFSIPLNLHANADHEEVGFISRPEFFDQFSRILAAQTDLVGSPYAENSWRDTKRDLSVGERIVQHRASLARTMLVASDPRFDYFDAVRYVDMEYARFRNKFVQQISMLLQSGERLVTDDPDTWVDTILKRLVVAKTDEFAFALSGMAGERTFIPATPSALGLLPCVTPRIEVDESFRPAISILRGHDGSRTPCFGDIRDAVLLAFERRIYRSIPAAFKGEARPAFDLLDYDDGLGRPASETKTRYSREEIMRLLTPSFMKWAQVNGLEYRRNTGYDMNDPFTWNYRGVEDRYGKVVPGHWRAIYQYYFDTDRPNTHPWEMLHFLEKPEWWDRTYGPAPYTRGNTRLWSDIAEGRIADGPRAGLDERLRRPFLMEVLPVDDDGGLLDPMAAQIILKIPAYQQATRPWFVGDGGPVEHLWRTSPSYRFALCQIAYLMRPGEWFEFAWDRGTWSESAGQWFDTRLGLRPRARQTLVHGEIDPETGLKHRAIGIQQWISDLMASRSLAPSTLGDILRGLEVRLAYRVGGYTRKENLRGFADNFGKVPDEDMEIHLHTSPPIREAVYSALIIEWTGEGYRVVGYNDRVSVFKTLKREENGPKSTIALGDETLVYEWHAGVYYPVGRIVEHEGSDYRCVFAHTSGNRFEEEFWSPASGIPKTKFPKVTMYESTTGEPEDVWYDTVLDSVQDVATFIAEYSMWLKEEGWIFDGTDPDTGEIQDWTLAVREFLKWAQMQWQPGNFIALSPGAGELKFFTEHGFTLNLEEPANGIYGLIDRTGRPLPKRSTFVTRMDEETRIVCETRNLFGARLRIAEMEHVIVFSNETIFGDLVYSPLLDIRQPRIRLIGMRTAPWTGRRDAAGYMVTGGDLLYNFEKASDGIRRMFEVEGSEDKTLRDFSRHLIGYQTRPYLDNLLLAETQQFEFYQGAIQQKGAPGVFKKLLRSSTIDQKRRVDFEEEWAFRLADFGATERTRSLSFHFGRGDVKLNPQPIQLRTEGLDPPVVTVSETSDRWVEKPDDLFPAFPVQLSAVPPRQIVPMTGYARLDEVDHVAFRYDLLDQLLAKLILDGQTMTEGTRIWVYQTERFTWDVLQATTLGSSTNTVWRLSPYTDEEYPGYLFTRVEMAEPHGLTAAALDGLICFPTLAFTNPDLQGFRRIASIDTDYSLIIDFFMIEGVEFVPESMESGQQIFWMRPTRFPNRNERQFNQVFNEATGIPTGTLTYIDDDGTGHFAVDRWNGSRWITLRRQPLKMDSARIEKAYLYEDAEIVGRTTIQDRPVLLDGISIFDPSAGLIPGRVESELSFMTDYDPATYDDQSVWGRDQVGKLWWDLSTVRFIETQTDRLDSNNAEAVMAEINYRFRHWGALAPGSVVDIYEWSKQSVKPANFIGETKRTAVTNFIEKVEYDPIVDGLVTNYYYWVRNPVTVPTVDGRRFSAFNIATLLRDMRNSTVPWVAPIAPNVLLAANLEPYLTTRSALHVEVADRTIEGVRHAEWELVKTRDERVPVPSRLWEAMRDAMVGFTERGHPVPDMRLQPRHRTGLSTRPQKSVFAGDGHDPRAGAFKARRTLVEALNTIFARQDILFERGDLVAKLAKSTPIYPLLAYAQPVNSTAFELPPPDAYDFACDDLDERDVIMESVDFMVARGYLPWSTSRFDVAGFDMDMSPTSLAHFKPRILVRNFESSRPGWTIWELSETSKFNPSNDDLLQVAQNFTHTMPTFADLKSAASVKSLVPGERILVEADETHAGMWAVWAYDPVDPDGDDDGLVVKLVQTYRTTDFFAVVDWYRPGYSANAAPSVVYPSIQTRNLAENPSPRNQFVKIANDGTGHWIWTAWLDNRWQVVAREKGTIHFSETLYDASRVTIGTRSGGVDLLGRDGSFDLKALMDTLYDEVLTPSEINEVFSALLHFVFTQTPSVDWAFKTSFLTVSDFDEKLSADPVQLYDNISNLLAYIDEIKPYHVKLRDHTRSMVPNRSDVDVGVKDFDKPLYYDAETNQHRRLDLRDGRDLEILRTVEPWKDWYDNLGTSLIRRTSVGLKFDRTDPDYPLFAAYAPTDGMVMRDLAELLQTNFKGEVIDAGDLFEPDQTAFSGWDIRAFDEMPVEMRLLSSGTDETYDNNSAIEPTSPLPVADVVLDGPGFIDPWHEAGRPQELASLHANEALSIHLHSDWSVGGPEHQTVTMDVSTLTGSVVVELPVHPQSRDAVMVYRDGIKASAQDFTVDLHARTVTVTLRAGQRTVLVHALGYASLGRILDQAFFDGGNTDTFRLSAPITGHVVVTVDGQRRQDVTVTAAEVTLSRPVRQGRDVAVTIYERMSDWEVATFEENPLDTVTSDLDPITTIATEVLPFATNRTWTLAKPSTGLSGPAHIGTVVSMNGRRLRPPRTFYGRLSGQRTSFAADAKEPSLLEIWADGERYRGPYLVATSLAEITALRDDLTNAIDFAWFAGTFYSLKRRASDRDIILVDPSDADYTVEGATLTLIAPLTSRDRVEVTTFQNAALMGITTHVVVGDPTITIPSPLPSLDRLAVYVNGLRKVPGWDYSLADTDEETTTSIAFAPGRVRPDDVVVIDAFAGREATPECDVVLLAHQMGLSVGRPRAANTVVTYDLAGSYRLTERRFAEGRLAVDLAPDADEITIEMNPLALSPKVVDLGRLTAIPEGGRTIVIGGETIRYFAAETSGRLVVLSQLQRGIGRGREHRTVVHQVYSGPGPYRFATPSQRFIQAAAIAPDGVTTPLHVIADYSATVVGGFAEVTLTRVFPAGTTLVFWQASGPARHEAGAAVFADFTAPITRVHLPNGALHPERPFARQAQAIGRGLKVVDAEGVGWNLKL